VLADVGLQSATAYAKPFGDFVNREQFKFFLFFHCESPVTRAVCVWIDKDSGLISCALKDAKYPLNEPFEAK